MHVCVVLCVRVCGCVSGGETTQTEIRDRRGVETVGSLVMQREITYDMRERERWSIICIVVQFHYLMYFM